jgi:hypothetical protein
MSATAGGTCVPTHCFVGWCGMVPDGCGHMLDCGACNPPPPADLGMPDLAGCVPSVKCVAGESCGNIDDGCGNILHCGDCAMPGTCSATTPNRCGCTPDKSSCDENKATCGAYPDGCGGFNNCFPGGALKCAMGNCGGGGPYTCGKGAGCTPLKECPAGACGLIPDGCRRYLTCGCPSGQICGGGGKPNQCG